MATTASNRWLGGRRHHGIEHKGRILLLVPLRPPEHHHPVLDRRAVEVIQTDLLGLWEREWVAGGRRLSRSRGQYDDGEATT